MNKGLEYPGSLSASPSGTPAPKFAEPTPIPTPRRLIIPKPDITPAPPATPPATPAPDGADYGYDDYYLPTPAKSAEFRLIFVNESSTAAVKQEATELQSAHAKWLAAAPDTIRLTSEPQTIRLTDMSIVIVYHFVEQKDAAERQKAWEEYIRKHYFSW